MYALVIIDQDKPLTLDKRLTMHFVKLFEKPKVGRLVP